MQKLTSALSAFSKRSSHTHSNRISDSIMSTSCTGIPRHYRFTGFVLVCLSSCFPLLLIILNGINVPFQDEYALAAVIKAIRLDQASFATLWAPHNEHRILVPRVIFSILIPVTGWNSVALMVASWAIITGAALFLYYCFARIFDSSKPRLWLLTVGISFLIFFSPIQRENWLWAFQLAFFLVQVGVILSLFSISFRSVALANRLLLAIMFGALASFSSAQGLMVWPALLVTQLLTEDTKKRKLIG